MGTRPLRGLALVIGVLVAGCTTGTPTTLDGVTLLRYGLLTGSPTAQQQGRLRVRDGCVWLEPIFLGLAQELELVLWPSSAGLDNSTGSIRVVIGDLALADGDEVTFGGGEYMDRPQVEGMVGPVPGRCASDLYWLATEAERGLLIEEASVGPMRT